MTPRHDANSERALILAPRGRDAIIASEVISLAGLKTRICDGVADLLREIEDGAGVAIITDEAIRDVDMKYLAHWVGAQPPWSDLPFIILTERGGGLERNPTAARQMETLGNVTFLERPFHPTTLISIVQTALRGRRRQYEARTRVEALRDSESHARRAEADLRKLNETLEGRVTERTGELEAANRQLVSQIEERERVEHTLRQMQRLEAVGQLTSGVAHDFNNLLTVVLGNLRFIEKSPALTSDTKMLQRLSHMRLAAERGAKLTSQLLAFSRRQKLEPKPIDLNDSLSNMYDLLQSTLGGSVQISTALHPDLWSALADPTQIELAVLNLAINARDAMEVGGSVTLETGNATVSYQERPEEPPPGEYVVISVTDTGSGMTKEVLAKVFEPFFTTKEVGKGSGLGLSQVLGFAKQSGGGMRIETRVGEGTSVKVYLPRAIAHENAENLDSVARAPSQHRTGAVILLVDDDSAVRDVTGSILRGLGYVVMEVGSGGAALDLLSQDNNIDLAVLDFAMPGMNGVELARQVQTKRPHLPILFVTGYVDTSALEKVGEERIIHKPFVDDELSEKVRLALSRSVRRSTGNVVAIGR